MVPFLPLKFLFPFGINVGLISQWQSVTRIQAHASAGGHLRDRASACLSIINFIAL